MSSRKRDWYPGAVFHVMGRGIRRLEIYKQEEDYLLFLMILREVKQQTGIEIYSLCLMTNHFHMVVRTGQVEIGRVMNRLMHRYARTFNSKYGFKGHLFDSRYSSGLIEDDTYLLEACRYVHLNPVKAMMVRSPEDYLYSNYPVFVGNYEFEGGNTVKEYMQALTTADRILNCFKGNAPMQYRNFVEGKLSHDEQEQIIRQDIGEDESWLPW